MKTEIIHPGCNGWAVIHKDLLESDGGCNFHMVEVKITSNNKGTDYVYAYNDEKVTCCGLDIKADAALPTKNFWRKGKDDDIRIQLAEWQNADNEFCGRCVGHFYKDPS